MSAVIDTKLITSDKYDFYGFYIDEFGQSFDMGANGENLHDAVKDLIEYINQSETLTKEVEIGKPILDEDGEITVVIETEIENQSQVFQVVAREK